MDWAKRLVYLSLGAASMTKDVIEGVVRDFIDRGEVTQEEGKALVKELLERGKKQKDEMTAFIAREVRRLAGEMPLATKSEVAELKKKLDELERLVRRDSDAR